MASKRERAIRGADVTRPVSSRLHDIQRRLPTCCAINLVNNDKHTGPRHETHLPSIEDPPRSHPRFSGPHEKPGWPGGDQCAPRQGPQALVGHLTSAVGTSVVVAPGLNSGLDAVVVRRLVQSVDFERALHTRVAARSEHFALHHVADAPSRWHPRIATPSAPGLPCSAELSTGNGAVQVAAVDDLLISQVLSPRSRPPVPLLAPPSSIIGIQWLGVVVPKRHARRAVTRSLIKRQIRAVIGSHAIRLTGGLWVVRLRAPFDRERFVSAASDELRRVARLELDALIDAAIRRQLGVSS